MLDVLSTAPNEKLPEQTTTNDTARWAHMSNVEDKRMSGKNKEDFKFEQGLSHTQTRTQYSRAMFSLLIVSVLQLRQHAVLFLIYKISV